MAHIGRFSPVAAKTQQQAASIGCLSRLGGSPTAKDTRDVHISRDKVHAWSASVALSGNQALRNVSILSPSERKRAELFRLSSDRVSYVLGRYMVRTLLSRILGIRPQELEFSIDQWGKPHLVGRGAESRLAFNLAHSAGQVVCAVAFDRKIGVDIEFERESLDFIDIARSYFSALETENLMKLPQAEGKRLFYRYWTLKEAILKAEGCGLSAPLKTVDVSRFVQQSSTSARGPIEDAPRQVRAHPLHLRGGFAAAIAADGPVWCTDSHELDPICP
jgi:4'-phosphopantetheinyl transferase